jgi:ATP-dependent helicase Lhr and Lhr-like helicase
LTNDTFHALRAFVRPPERRARKARGEARPFRSRRVAPPSAEGRWSLLRDRTPQRVSPTEAAAALAQQLLSRYGVLTREVAAAEGIAGGFGAVYDVLKAMEDAGRIRRGYFVGGVGATQFAVPAALDLLRSLRETPDEPEVVVIAATDPANPYGTILHWPEARAGVDGGGRGPTRSVGALVVLVNGALAAYISRGARQLTAFLPEDEPARSTSARALAGRLAALARGEDGGIPLLITDINGTAASEHPLAPYLVDAGFSPSAMGFQMRRHA